MAKTKVSKSEANLLMVACELRAQACEENKESSWAWRKLARKCEAAERRAYYAKPKKPKRKKGA